MISASHNSFADNGVKLFTADGKKLSDEVEERLEKELLALLGGLESGSARTGEAVGTIVDGSSAVDRWAESVAGSIQGRGLAGLTVVVDCANGAASAVAPRVLRALGATVEVIHDQPDGTNINADCGSTYPDDLRRAVVTRGADVGLAFDGDADRVLAIDATGRLIDGDQIIGICAIDRHAHGRLAKDTVVVTVMTNLGFRLGMAEHGVEVLEVPVGDRYVLEAIADGDLSLGGEQSGHVVFADLATTGDGLLTAIQLLDIVRRSERPARGPGRLGDDPTAPGAPERERRHEGLGRHHDAGRRHRGGGGRARRSRPSADPRERNRAPRPRDGRGPHPRAGGGRGRPPGAGGGGPRGGLIPPVRWSGPPTGRPPPLVCGIIALLRGPGARLDLPPSAVLDRLTAVQDSLDDVDPIAAADRAAELLEELDGLLRSPDGVALLVRNREVAARTEAVTAVAGDWAASVEGGLDAHGAPEGHSLESANASLLRLKDALWAVARDRLPTATAVRELVGESRSWSAIEVGTSIQQALSALDRLEVRGRDSAGLTVLVRDHGLDLDDPAVARLVSGAQRGPPLPLERRPHPGGPPQLRLQGGRGDRRAR